jgi:hypothetical protein
MALEGASSPLVRQPVPESQSATNRVHLDVVAEDVEAELDRRQHVGAPRGHDGRHSIGSVRWVTMADPEDDESCVSAGVEW